MARRNELAHEALSRDKILTYRDRGKYNTTAERCAHGIEEYLEQHAPMGTLTVSEFMFLATDADLLKLENFGVWELALLKVILTEENISPLE